MFFQFFLVKGKIRAATGKARLLMSSKFKQFKNLCDLNAVSLNCYEKHALSAMFSLKNAQYELMSSAS